jgi:hypothetical protein
MEFALSRLVLNGPGSFTWPTNGGLRPSARQPRTLCSPSYLRRIRSYQGVSVACPTGCLLQLSNWKRETKILLRRRPACWNSRMLSWWSKDALNESHIPTPQLTKGPYHGSLVTRGSDRWVRLLFDHLLEQHDRIVTRSRLETWSICV